MPTTTSRRQLVKPGTSDGPATLRTAIGTNADKLDQAIGYSEGTSLPATAVLGDLYRHTSTGELYIWDGTAWCLYNQSMLANWDQFSILAGSANTGNWLLSATAVARNQSTPACCTIGNGPSSGYNNNSAANSQLTFPRAGLYRFSGRPAWSGTAPAGSSIKLAVAGLVRYSRAISGNFASATPPDPIVTTVRLSAGDTMFTQFQAGASWTPFVWLDDVVIERIAP